MVYSPSHINFLLCLLCRRGQRRDHLHAGGRGVGRSGGGQGRRVDPRATDQRRRRLHSHLLRLHRPQQMRFFTFRGGNAVCWRTSIFGIQGYTGSTPTSLQPPPIVDTGGVDGTEQLVGGTTADGNGMVIRGAGNGSVLVVRCTAIQGVKWMVQNAMPLRNAYERE